MLFRLFRLFAIVVMLVVAFVYAPRWWQEHQLEQKVAQLTQQLAADGLDGIDATVADDRLHLAGNVRVAAQRDRVMRLAARHFMREEIVNDIAVAPPVSPYRFAAQLEGGRLLLQGYVPGEQQRQALHDWLASQGLVLAQDRLRLAEGAPVDWEPTVKTALKALQVVGDGDVEIAWRTVLLRGKGIAPRASVRARKLLASLARAGYETELRSLPVLSCLDRVQALAVASPLRFEAGRAVISPDSKRFLDELAEVASSCPETAFTVHGYTDNRGDPEANRALSQQRAEAVVQALVARGVPPDQFNAIGHGSASPIADNATEAGRARNRRIEFTVNESTISDKQK